MSEQIHARGDITITGTSGDAVCGEHTALTRWVPAGQAVLSPAGAVAHRASGCADEPAANSGNPPEPRHRLRPDRPGSAVMTAAHRTRECHTRCVPRLARLRLLAGDGAARRCRPVPPAKWVTRPGRSWPKPAPPGKPPWPPSRKAAAVPRPCSWRPGRPGWRPRPTTSLRRLRTGAPQRCRGPCAGSRRSPRHCGRCSPSCAPRRRHRPAHLAGPAPRYARRTAARRIRILNHAGGMAWPGIIWHQHVEVSDDGRTVAAAEVIISEQTLRDRPGVAARRVRAHHSRPPREPGRRGAGPSRGAGKRAPGRRHSRSAMASRCSDFSSAEFFSNPAILGAAPCWMRARPPGRPGSTA